MAAPTPSIFVFCALACEARPLIKAWRLKKNNFSVGPFVIYADQTRLVVITGIGKTAMAGAVGYVMALYAYTSVEPIMINLGIAGHLQHPLGEVFLADKILDAETGKAYFPQFPFGAPCGSMALITYPKPQNGYQAGSLSDMEAASFYEMAVKFSSSELIHVLKIVSDNQQNSVESINEAIVEGWMIEQMAVIDGVIACLRSLQASLCSTDVSVMSAGVLQRVHFTQANTYKLNLLLSRWSAIRGGQSVPWEKAETENASGLLNWLEMELNRMEFYL